PRGTHSARRGISDPGHADVRFGCLRVGEVARQQIRDLHRDRRGLLMGPRRERGRAVRRALATAGLVGVFLLAAVGGVLLHVRFGLGRRLAASIVTSALEKTFLGHLVVEKFGTIDADGFDAAEVSVFDPAGRRVLAVSGLRGRASLARLAFSILKGGNDIAIMISRARVEHADVTIIPDEDGVPSLARAFMPRPSPGARSSAAPNVSVWIPEVELR